jgi:hypothetical protein
MTLATLHPMHGFLDELARISRRINEATFAFQHDDGSERGFVQFICHPGKGLHLHRIWALKTGLGCGSVMLRSICALADRHGVDIHLKATPFGSKPYPMSREDLAAWYRRHGFEGPRWALARKPKMSCGL